MAFLGHIPGSKLPGYLRVVPPGQIRFRRTVRKIEPLRGKSDDRLRRKPNESRNRIAAAGLRLSGAKTQAKQLRIVYRPALRAC